MNDSRRMPRDGRANSRAGAPAEPSRPRAHDVREDRPPMAPVSSALPPAPGTDVLADGAYKMYALLSHPQARARIAPLLVPGGTPADKDDAWERVVANVMRASRNDPKIERCKGTTILDAVATIVGAWHLEIGETADLVPFKEGNAFICTPIMRYTGMAQLMLASGAVRKIQMWCYYENEIATGRFKVRGGTNSGIDHDPMRHTERGKLAGAYVVATVRGQVEMWSYMAIEDIEVIRAKSRSWSPRVPGAPKECPEWYAKKTALRQFAKLIPKSREIMRAFKAIHQDEIAELPMMDGEESSHLAARPEQPALNAGAAPVEPEGPTPVLDDAPPPPDDDEWQDDRDLVDDGEVAR